MMTWTDLYVTVTLLSVVASIAVAIGWTIDCWPEWRARHESFAVLAQDLWAEWGWWATANHRGTVSSGRADPSPRPVPQAEWVRRAAVAYGVEPSEVHGAMLARYRGNRP